MIDWQAILDAINAQLGGRTAVAAVLAGLLCSLAFTQALKKLGPDWERLSDRQLRLLIRVTAFAFGFVPTFALWPQRGWAAVSFGFVVGVLAPAIYTLAARIAVHYWPWLDAALSARPTASNDSHEGDAP